MRILLLAPGCSGYKLLELYSDIAKEVLILGRSKYKEKFNQIFSQAKQMKNVKVKFKSGIKSYLTTAKILAKNYDLVISQDPFSAFCAAQTKKKKLFFMCQDFMEYLEVAKINSFYKSILRPIYKFMLNYSCKRCNVVCLSNHVKDSAIKYGAKNPKIIPVFGVNTKVFSKKKSDIKSKYKIKGKLILTVGKLEAYKGTEYLIRAFKDIPNSKLMLIGSGSMKNYLVNLIKKLNLEKDIIMIDKVEHNKLADYYNACDVFVLPSLEEGLGFVSAEALSCEKPVVASKTGGIPDIVIHNKTGLLVKPGNSKELSSAILEILNNPKKANKLAKEGKKHILKNFEEKKVMDSYKKFILRLI